MTALDRLRAVSRRVALPDRMRHAAGRLRGWHAHLTAYDRHDVARPRRRAAFDLGVLALCGFSLVGLSIWMARWRVVATHYHAFTAIFIAETAIYALAAVWVIRRAPPMRGALAVIFLVALAARLAFVPQIPTVSDDVYRYVWDGRVQAAGINPYRYAPNDPALFRYRDRSIYPGINRKPVHTIYPPVAQAIFRVVYQLHPNSVFWTKLALALLDLVTMAMLVGVLMRVGLRPDRVLLYAWQPLLILEVGHSGHIDAVAAFFLVLALGCRGARRDMPSGALLACATLIKFYALVALPAFFSTPRRTIRLLGALLATTVLAYLPFLSVGARVFGYLPGYVQEEGIASGDRYYLLHQITAVVRWLPGDLPTLLARSPVGVVSAATWYEGGIVVAMLACAWGCWLRPARSARDVADRTAILFIVLLALATPSQPWYTLLLLACAPLVRRIVLIPLSLTVACAGIGYLHWWYPSRPAWPLIINYDGRALALALLLGGLFLAWRNTRGRQTIATRADAEAPASVGTKAEATTAPASR